MNDYIHIVFKIKLGFVMWGIFIYMDITSFGVDCFIVGI
nr:MAG TPA_asm: hypothetical protein [Caudoviricetes sp.]